MRPLICLMAVCAVCVACRRESDPPRAVKPAVAPKTNVVSQFDAKGRPTATAVYATNGQLKYRSFFDTGADGRVVTARTVDAEGRSKWTEQYFYGEASAQRPSEIRRTQPDGKIIAVRFLRSPDGTERRIVVGPDGNEIPPGEQAALLEE